MGPIRDAMIKFFQDDDWQITAREDPSVIQLAFSGEHGQWLCLAQARDQQEQFVFYSLCPITAPPEQRERVAEFLHRANFGLVMGNFELDYTDGEVRFKTGIDVEGDRLSEPLIRQMVYTNVLAMDRYLPGLMAVIYGHESPEQAVQRVEAEAEA